MTHTPGPWWRDDDGFVAAGSGDTYVTIADFDCSLDLDIDEREANKALGLAAPDMLAALKLVDEHREAISHHTPFIVDILDAVTAAIAKAESTA